jgi:inner membrane protein
MIIGHLPAGYLLTRRLDPRLVGWGLLGSVLPDFDLFYFYLVDGRSRSHHAYWPHLPAYWLAAALLLALLAPLLRRRAWLAVPAVLVANSLVHLALDTIAGGIRWLYPWSLDYVRLTVVPARFDWWLMSFIFHWTFLLDLALCAWAWREWNLSTSDKVINDRHQFPLQRS